METLSLIDKNSIAEMEDG